MAIEVVRVSAGTSEAAFSLIEEYYEAVDVLVRDDRGVLQSYAADADGGIWLAYFDGQPAGCIVLRTQSKLDAAGEVKRLYVRPAYRGRGVALHLLTELERFAVARGFQWLYLDSKDDLRNAIVFYRRCGYETCDRYNDNPQATVFLRKALAAVGLSFQR